MVFLIFLHFSNEIRVSWLAHDNLDLSPDFLLGKSLLFLKIIFLVLDLVGRSNQHFSH